MWVAITREVSPAIGDCELTHLPRCRIDASQAQTQHAAYEDCLVRLGCRLRRLAAEPALPDSVFVEDTCVVLEELAVMSRPGAPSRRGETHSVAEVLKEYRDLRYIEAPGTLDGGDVLVHGKTVYVGQSTRTNREAAEQMQRLLGPLGYRVHAIEVRECLHLKSAISLVAEDIVLVNRSWVDVAGFRDLSVLDVDPSEPWAGNALLVAGVVLYPQAFPWTRQRLEQAGIEVVTVDLSELHKAEGGVTCCSVVFRTSASQ
jgi:dimethylargininase